MARYEKHWKAYKYTYMYMHTHKHTQEECIVETGEI